MTATSRVFISYSHESSEHKQRVLAFANRLVQEGIDVTLDQWAREPAGGWPFWMERELASSRHVLVVCTREFHKRMESAEVGAGGKGVFWEANLLRGYLYSTRGNDPKYIPVHFGPPEAASIPPILATATSYRIDSPAGYLALYRRLTGQPEVAKPELGQILVMPTMLCPDDTGNQTLQEPEARISAAHTFQKLVPLAHCDERGLCSTDGSVSTFIRFDNYLSEDIMLYWLNYEGHRVFYAYVRAGESRLQQTYVSHPWVVTRRHVSDQGRCIAIFLPNETHSVADISS